MQRTREPQTCNKRQKLGACRQTDRQTDGMLGRRKTFLTFNSKSSQTPFFQESRMQ